MIQSSTNLYKSSHGIGDYLSTAGVYFADEDIVILALNGLLSKYNTFRCVVMGRESVISLNEFRSQLLVEEHIVDNIIPDNSTYIVVMNTMSKSLVSSTPFLRSSHNQQGFPSYDNGGYRL